MFRACMFIVIFLAATAQCHAHFVFVLPVEGGKSIRVVLSDKPAPDASVAIKIIESTKLMFRMDGKDTPLKLDTADSYLSANIPSGGVRVVHGVTEYGVVRKGESKPFLLSYHPKAIIGDPFSRDARIGKEAAIEIVAVREGTKVKFLVLASGKALSGAEVILRRPNAEKTETLETDDTGHTPSFEQIGRFAVVARKLDTISGELDGKKYEEVRRYATLVADIPDATVSDKLSGIRRTLFTGGRIEADQVAPALKQIGKLDLSQSDRESWVRLARDTAIRQEDREWLLSLRDVEDSFGMDMIYTVLLASGQLAKADLKEAKLTLDRIKDLEEINEREKRRVHSIRARISQLEGNLSEERGHINKLVDHLHLWTKPMCQTCHSNPSEPKAMTGMPLTNLWFGERYVELLRKQGDAEKIRSESEAKLKTSPDDEKARIRLAFALKALGKDSEAESHFRIISWAEFPDRQLPKARMMTTFP